MLMCVRVYVCMQGDVPTWVCEAMEAAGISLEGVATSASHMTMTAKDARTRTRGGEDTTAAVDKGAQAEAAQAAMEVEAA